VRGSLRRVLRLLLLCWSHCRREVVVVLLLAVQVLALDLPCPIEVLVLVLVLLLKPAYGHLEA
jgi:hypothetical protein